MTHRRCSLAAVALLLIVAAPALAQTEAPRKREKAPPWVVVLIACGVGGAIYLLRGRMIAQDEANAPSARREDPADVDPTVVALREELRRGAWEGVRRRLEATTDGAERVFLVHALTGAAAAETLDRWVDAEPRCAVARLLRGNKALDAAGEARGAGRASDVADEDMAEFEALSAQADDDLVAAAELDPADPTPHALRLVSAVGTGVDAEEQEARFRAAVERDPLHLMAHTQRLTLLCEKWGGSHERMFAFAREASASAPAGSPVHVLVVLAHIERWLWGVAFAGEAERTPGFAEEYFAREDVRRELLDAHARSIGAPGWREQPGHFVRNAFAFAFWMGDDVAGARRELETIGARWGAYPWGYAGEPAKVVARARVAAGLAPSP